MPQLQYFAVNTTPNDAVAALAALPTASFQYLSRTPAIDTPDNGIAIFIANARVNAALTGFNNITQRAANIRESASSWAAASDGIETGATAVAFSAVFAATATIGAGMVASFGPPAS